MCEKTKVQDIGHQNNKTCTCSDYLQRVTSRVDGSVVIGSRRSSSFRHSSCFGSVNDKQRETSGSDRKAVESVFFLSEKEANIYFEQLSGSTLFLVQKM